MEASIPQLYKDRMKDFPCAFNLECSKSLSPARLKHIQHNLDSDLKDQACCQSEVIRRNNLLTWILCLLDKHDEAAQLNADCCNQTKSSNVACLGNRFFILCIGGDELGADQCFHDLQKMKDRVDYSILLIEAKAEQAYYYSRLGGLENLTRAISLFSEATEKNPENYLWKFGLGLCFRRATNEDIFCSSAQPLDIGGCKKLAADCFFDVAEIGDRRFKSLAYAQLLTLWQIHPEGVSDVFRGQTILDLCEAALRHGPDVPTVLTRCGNAVRKFDIDKSIDMLQKSLILRKNTITYHFLAISYHKKAEQVASNSTTTSVKEIKSFQETAEEEEKIVCENFELEGDCEELSIQSPKIKNRKEQFEFKEMNETITSYSSKECPKLQEILKTRVRKFTSQLNLNKDCQFVNEAVKYYNNSIELSKINVPAILDYGMLLKQTGQLNEALIQFNKVTITHLVFADHRVSVISANEEAGLCYFELSKSQENSMWLEEKGKQKLTTAISLAADLALVNPELKNCAKEVWTAFRTLETNINQAAPSADRSKKKIELLRLVRDYGQIIDVVQKIREYSDFQLNEPSVITATLDSYLNLQQPDNALAFIKLVAIIPDVRNSAWWNTDSMKDLRTKVFFHTLSARLLEASGNPTPLFQQIFEMTIGTRYGLDFQDDEAETCFAGDILIVFDEEESEEVCRSTTKVAGCLKDAAVGLFGLRAEINLQGNSEYGDTKEEIQLREMKKYPVIIVVVTKEQRSGIFTALLKCMSRSLKPKHLAILTVDAVPRDNVLPLCLKQFTCSNLEDVGLGNISNISDEGSSIDQSHYMDIKARVFHGDVNAVLKLFCFMIGQNHACFA